MSKPNNPPAFPCKYVQYDDEGMSREMNFEGMSLRDYFAAKAMQGMVSPEQPQNIKTLVPTAYEIADAMLLERAKEV